MTQATAQASVASQTIAVEHIRISSRRPFGDVRRKLEGTVPKLDAGIAEALQSGDQERAKIYEDNEPMLSIFVERDHGSLLLIWGRRRNTVQYEIGNPLTASKMTRHQLAAALYAPLRVVLFEDEQGHGILEYDRPSSFFGQYGDDAVTEVGRYLDATLEAVLQQSCGVTMPGCGVGRGFQRRASAMFDITLPHEDDIRSPCLAASDPVEGLDLFLRENHHRMKNMLTLLGAWLRADFISTASVDLPKAIDGFERRILAFGRLYDLLSRHSDRRYTSVVDYIGSLSLALAAAILEPRGIRCEVTIGDGFLDSKRCERLGLIIVELVTNAAKYAFSDQQPGLVRIEAFYGDGFWHCTVKDSGVGARGARGLGGRIVEDLARAIGGHTVTDSDSDGTAITVVVPHRS